MIQELEFREIISIPDWIILFPFLKIKLVLLALNGEHFAHVFLYKKPSYKKVRLEKSEN